MKVIQKWFMVLVLMVCLVATASHLWAQTPAEDNCGQVIALLQNQNSQLSNDMRRIQRELAALRADINQPGFKEVLAGIGYIFGLFGTGAFMASRRRG